MLKLYVLMAMVEVFDRLMCSFGQDALDSLYWNTTVSKRYFYLKTLIAYLHQVRTYYKFVILSYTMI